MDKYKDTEKLGEIVAEIERDGLDKYINREKLKEIDVRIGREM